MPQSAILSITAVDPARTGLVARIVSFSFGAEIGQILALTALTALTAVLVGCQLTGYFTA